MLDVLWSVGAFAIAIGVLVSFHEFGHFWVARKLGIKVLRYSIGFGKVVWSRQGRDGTEYAISALPLGGYVKMLDEREGIVPPAELHRAFNRKPVAVRAAVVAAGPIFNLLLAIAAYWCTFVAGIEGVKPVIQEPPANTAAARAGLHQNDEIVAVNGEATPTFQVLRTVLVERVLDAKSVHLKVNHAGAASRDAVLPLAQVRVDPEVLFDDLGLRGLELPIPAVLQEVVPGDPAAQAGFKPGDRLLAHDGKPIASWQDWAGWLRAHPGEVSKVEVQRGNEKLTLTVIIARDGERGRFGARVEVPPGLWDNLRAEYRLDVFAALPAAVAQTWDMSALTLKMLFRMVLGEISVKNVSGPIQIAQFAGYSASVGLVSFLSFIAVVSVSLAVLNLLPVPVLDGGHLLYYVVEAIQGRPLSERAQQLGQQIGLALLLMLMGLAFYNDISRLIS